MIDPTNYDIASAKSNPDLKGFKRNDKWEVAFRKLSLGGSGAYDVGPENDNVLTLKASDVKNGIPANESTNCYSVSRNPGFVMDVMGSGNNKLVVIVNVPPDFGVDFEAEYLADYRSKHKADPPEYVNNQPQSKLSKEILMQRVPSCCVYGWIARTRPDPSAPFTLTLTRNNGARFKTIVDPRFEDLMNQIRALTGIVRVGF